MFYIIFMCREDFGGWPAHLPIFHHFYGLVHLYILVDLFKLYNVSYLERLLTFYFTPNQNLAIIRWPNSTKNIPIRLN